MPHQSIPLSLYVHLPWCERKCPYCDFNSHPSVGGMDEGQYVDALIRDLEHNLSTQPEFLASRPIESVFFGGGTPSLFSASGIARILESASQRLSFADDIEITLEANPGSSEQARFRGYRDAGVNRLSIGIQSLDETKLKKLGRIHNRDEALHAAESARAAGFDNFNLDLMFALPEQNLEQAASDLQQIVDLAPTHISYYQLTLEPGTHFHMHPPKLPQHDLAWEMQIQCERMLDEAGYTQYEVSAYAQIGRQCRHNLNYWQFGDYLGIGAGAHGKLTHNDRIIRSAKQRLPIKYMDHTGSDAAITEHRDVMLEDRSFEFLLNALRLKEGFSLETYSISTGLDPQILLRRLQSALDQKLVSMSDHRLCTTERGWRHIDSILAALLDE